jgi:hypothetical protein
VPTLEIARSQFTILKLTPLVERHPPGDVRSTPLWHHADAIVIRNLDISIRLVSVVLNAHSQVLYSAVIAAV